MTRRQANQLCYASYILGVGAGILIANKTSTWWLLLIYGMLCGGVVTVFINHWTPRRKRASRA